MFKLRLKKYGRKKKPFFRIVSMDSRTKRDGASIEELGAYNPRTKKMRLKVKRIRTLLSQGAKPTKTVYNIIIKTLPDSTVHYFGNLNIQHQSNLK